MGSRTSPLETKTEVGTVTYASENGTYNGYIIHHEVVMLDLNKLDEAAFDV